ncbi:GNAT family N-acetyltransferase [Isoptericola sp. b441]|uniref:GNAT family N-acetyltransferase n=1 Tax=Actinotalea lenta TaxID=3064654 RepID=A0ABT9DDH5_9CELL|nr:GNAT family N-acetyltransferase [Isoptericola sp. b441]MDO8108293.1 GNAT family N-acetyltransferase [Isoptericola sp. b441]
MASVLRPATEQDVGRIAEIWHVGWHDGHAGHVPDGLTAVRTRPAFDARAAARLGQTTVAVAHGEVAGFVMVVGDEVEQLFVAREHRGTGVADTLLAEGERQIMAAGRAVPWLAVVEGNARARRFYERNGWHDVGPLPYHVQVDGQEFVSPCRRYERG